MGFHPGFLLLQLHKYPCYLQLPVRRAVLVARRQLPTAVRSFDEESLFGFAEGQTPNFSAETYRTLD